MLKLDWNIIFNMINILILYFLMKKFLFGPITDIMEKRKNNIESTLDEAEKKKTQTQKMKEEYEGVLANADVEATNIIKEARQRAVEVHDKQILETKEETARLLEEANKLIELEKKKSMQSIQSEIAGIAMLAAAKVIQKNVDDNTNEQLVNDFIKEAGAAK